jgi:hypothetical protein
MIGAFDFEDGGRTYSCVVEDLSRGRNQLWWWFRVSGDGHRYAPFTAASEDTLESVRSRILEYYNNHLARRSAPALPRGSWGRRPQPPAPAPQSGTPS